ncbi:MAG TPA: AraC family transcriptional regulator [Caulobacteraceae bacterium]
MSVNTLEVERLDSPDARPFLLFANVMELLEVARTELERDHEVAKASVTRAARILRSELKRQHTISNPESRGGILAEWQMKRLKIYVDSHLGETIRLTDLSEVAQRSKSHFCRTFKRSFGQTPHGYVTARRLERAKSLMLETDERLCVIAGLCGFTDQAHLSRLFRQHSGETPAAWRRRRLLNDWEPPILT